LAVGWITLCVGALGMGAEGDIGALCGKTCQEKIFLILEISDIKTQFAQLLHTVL